MHLVHSVALHLPMTDDVIIHEVTQPIELFRCVAELRCIVFVSFAKYREIVERQPRTVP